MSLFAPLVFLLSALREGLGVFWVHFAERDRAHRVGVVAMVQAVAEIAGVGLSIQSLPCAGAYVIGHYVGVQIAMRAKRRLPMHASAARGFRCNDCTIDGRACDYCADAYDQARA